MINWQNFEAALKDYGTKPPFDHCVVSDFFETDAALALASEFPPNDSPKWFSYKNAIEDKKALNDWNAFPALTYQAFTAFYSDRMIARLEELLKTKVFRDYGLHGGGWHMHGPGGNLNPHLDYSIHPKMQKERKLNIIVYLGEAMKAEYGGHLGLWRDENGQPGELVAEVEPRFNSAILFDTTQKSWHGMSRGLTQPEGIYRKSLAVYYMREPAPDAPDRGRALFAPREAQKGDESVEELIRKRSSVAESASVYRDN
jgi:hypothetical protein